MADAAELLDIIERVVQDELKPAQILDVRVSEDVDHEGDPILRVEIVFEVEGNRLDPARVVGLGRHLREPLQKLQEDRFPLFTFMTRDEIDGAAA